MNKRRKKKEEFMVFSCKNCSNDDSFGSLCFVLKHMASELNSLCIYCEPEEYGNNHINKIVKKKNKKKKKRSKK